MAQLTKGDIRQLLELLGAELAKEGVVGEVYMVGGAVLCLALDARPSTRDIDAFFKPTDVIRAAARRVGAKRGLPDDWLNDAVKGYLSPRGEFDPYLDLPNLRVFTARADYLLAMKCMAMRLGEEFHDLDDVRYLLRYQNITRVDQAIEIVMRYFQEEHVPAKTRLLLEELLPE